MYLGWLGCSHSNILGQIKRNIWKRKSFVRSPNENDCSDIILIFPKISPWEGVGGGGGGAVVEFLSPQKFQLYWSSNFHHMLKIYSLNEKEPV